MHSVTTARDWYRGYVQFPVGQPGMICELVEDVCRIPSYLFEQTSVGKALAEVTVPDYGELTWLQPRASQLYSVLAHLRGQEEPAA